MNQLTRRSKAEYCIAYVIIVIFWLLCTAVALGPIVIEYLKGY